MLCPARPARSKVRDRCRRRAGVRRLPARGSTFSTVASGTRVLVAPPPRAPARSGRYRAPRSRARRRGRPPRSAGRRASSSPCAGQLARQAVAHAHGQAGAASSLAHDLEVVVEGRDLVAPRPSGGSSARPAPPGGGHAGSRSASLSLCRCLDQQVAPVAGSAGAADQRAHLDERLLRRAGGP